MCAAPEVRSYVASRDVVVPHSNQERKSAACACGRAGEVAWEARGLGAGEEQLLAAAQGAGSAQPAGALAVCETGLLARDSQGHCGGAGEDGASGSASRKWPLSRRGLWPVSARRRPRRGTVRRRAPCGCLPQPRLHTHAAGAVLGLVTAWHCVAARSKVALPEVTSRQAPLLP